jgi:Tfp pilus assembly protein PilW
MMIRRVRLMARFRSDDGFSITELVVTIFVTLILMSIVAALFINVVKVTSNANATTARSSTAANVMNEISTIIRPATNNPIVNNDTPDPAIVDGTPLSLSIYSMVDAVADSPAPTKVSLSIDSQGYLVETRVAGSLSSGYWVFTATPTTRRLPGPLQSLTGTNALFVYKDALNADVTPGSTGLTLAQRRSIVSIKVTVSFANQPTTGADAITIINTFGMPNLKNSGTSG